MRALRFCGLKSDSPIVDIGCGGGGTLEQLEKIGFFNLRGLDCSDELLSDARQRLVTTFLIRGDAETLPFRDNSFDALLCECVLSVIHDKERALDEFGRILNRDGFLIMSDVFSRGGVGENFVPGKKPWPGSGGLPTKGRLCKWLKGHGFSSLLWEEHEGLLREFFVRMIFAGHKIPKLWRGRQGQGEEGAGRRGTSYFLLVARKRPLNTPE